MHNFKAALFGALLSMMLTQISYAATGHEDWPEYKADAAGYFESHLPSPVVIYVYTSSGRLESILSTKGHDNKASIRKLGDILVDKGFPSLTDPRRDSIAKFMKYFLLNQGYSLDEIINMKTRFTLLLTLFTIKKNDCDTYRQIHDEYEHVIEKAIQFHTKPEYSVAILRLQSPLVHLKCGG